jgi:hypothetical protein
MSLALKAGKHVVGRRNKHCRTGHAVAIEPGLRRRSPKNGNIWIFVRRLSAIWACKAPNLEPGDWPMDRKSPPLAGFSLVVSGNFPK